MSASSKTNGWDFFTQEEMDQKMADDFGLPVGLFTRLMQSGGGCIDFLSSGKVMLDGEIHDIEDLIKQYTTH